MEHQCSGLRRVLVQAFCVAGIWLAYIYQGVRQETVSTKRYGLDKERFWSGGSSGGAPWWTYWSGGAPWWTYWSAGITNTIGPAMGIEALKYISYPVESLHLHF